MADSTLPDNTSGDYDAMQPYWRMVGDILDGADAMRSARTGSDNPYLPKFPNETASDYAYRTANAKFTNIYRDIVETLAAKPFTKEQVGADLPSPFDTIAEDVDGAGNNMHVFAQNVFFTGMNNAIDWIMVDYVKVRPGTTLADERRMNARPYWVHVPATRVLAVYSARIGAKEELVHVRIFETGKSRDGYDEVITNRIRVYDRAPIVDEQTQAVVDYAPATFEVYEQRETTKGSGAKSSSWELIDEGQISIGIIPMVPFIAGRRKEGTWQFVPPLQDVAYLQVEHFQQETGLKYAKEQTAFPMLAGNGVSPSVGDDGTPLPVPVGPKSVLYAPPNGEGEHGEWRFIEPSAESLRFLADDVKNTEQQLREIGRQPLTAQTGNLTVVTTAFAGDKANSVIQAWTLNLKDALENALKVTARWLGQSDGPEVMIDTDFDIGLSDEEDPKNLLEMRKNGDLSARTLGEEYRRRGILSADWEYETENERIIEEMPSDDEQDMLDAVRGQQAA